MIKFECPTIQVSYQVRCLGEWTWKFQGVNWVNRLYELKKAGMRKEVMVGYPSNQLPTPTEDIQQIARTRIAEDYGFDPLGQLVFSPD